MGDILVQLLAQITIGDSSKCKALANTTSDDVNEIVTNMEQNMRKQIFNWVIKSFDADFELLAAGMEKHLESYTYLTSESVTNVDIVTFCWLTSFFNNTAVDKKSREEKYPCITRWFNTVMHDPIAKKAQEVFKNPMSDINRVLKVKQMAKADKVKKVETVAPKRAPKANKQDVAPVAAASAPAAAAVDDGDQDDEEKPAAKQPNPFSALPAGTFNMEAFKRCYSNEETNVSIEHFWKNFDPENYSIWYAEYKYPEELKLVFMSCNLISGMFQRLEKMRSGAFASVCVFGSDNDNTISGVWVLRGHDLAFKLCPDWQTDYESYEWLKLDPNDPKTKTTVNNYLEWKGTDQKGRAFNQGKIYK